MAEALGAELGIDTSVPSIARMYDYWLGGKDHFAADREAADHVTHAIPCNPQLARQNRDFLGRAVSFCAYQGITQFLDIGSGLPTNKNVHEVAQLINPQARVAYVDIDPAVVIHAQALLAGSQTVAIRGDVCHPDDIVDAPAVRRLIEFGKPVAVLILSVLHAIPEDADPAGAVARLRDLMAPGSYLVISHAEVSTDHVVGTRRLSQAAQELQDAYKALASVPGRTRADILRLFGDLTLVEPGLTDVWAWRPEGEPVEIPGDFLRMLGGVARKD